MSLLDEARKARESSRRLGFEWRVKEIIKQLKTCGSAIIDKPEEVLVKKLREYFEEEGFVVKEEDSDFEDTLIVEVPEK